MNYSRSMTLVFRSGLTLKELLVAMVVSLLTAGILFTMSCGGSTAGGLAVATQKMQALGTAFTDYAADSGGLLPFEDVAGSDDWTAAAKPEASEVWYNALPRQMGEKTVGEIGTSDAQEFYRDTYPLYLPGAPYPKSDKKFRKPYFAFAMNSRLQRRSDDGTKAQGTLASIKRPERTVVFLERGMPGDEETMEAQKGFDAGPKASPRAFVGRYGGKGVILFADGHTETRQPSELISRTGRIIHPNETTIWTANPDDDPN